MAKVLGGLVLFIAIGTGLAVTQLGSVIKTGVEEAGPELTGTPVSLKDAQVSLLFASGNMHELVIGNPEGFESPYAFTLGTLDFELAPETVLDEVVVIEKLHIDGVQITAELAQDGRTNLKVINDHLQSLVQQNTASVGAEGASDPNADSTKRFVIQSFAFTNAQLRALAPALNVDKSLQVPDIFLNDIGTSEQGLSLPPLVNALLEPVVEQSVAEVRADFKASALDKIKSRLGEILPDKLWD